VAGSTGTTESWDTRAWAVAEVGAEVWLARTGRLRTWADQAELQRFHADLWPGWPRRPRVFLTEGRRSVLRPRPNVILLAAEDHHVVAYSHEVGHALDLARSGASGHHARWGGLWLAVLGLIDPEAAYVLGWFLERYGLTPRPAVIDSHLLRRFTVAP
jgi:hypothetical protein